MNDAQYLYERVNATKLVQPHFRQYLGTYCEGQGTEDILNGTIQQDKIPNCEYIHTYLEQLNFPNSIPTPTIENDISTVQLKDLLLHTKEMTA